MKRSLTILCMILLLTAGSAMAQDDWGFNARDWTFSISASGTSDDSVDNTTFSAEASLGYFLTHGLEVGARQGIGYADVEGGDDLWNGSTRVYADYNFDLQRFQPFLGVNVGYLYGDNVNETWIAGPEGGLKFFLVKDAYLLGMVEYSFVLDGGDEDDAFDNGRFVYTLGIGVRW